MQILKKELKLKGKSVEWLAESLSVSRTAVYLWLSGEFLPRATHVKKMLDLGFSEDAVISPSKEA